MKAGYGVQVPRLPGSAQLWHVPPQLLLQHTRSTQSPEAHSVEAAHAVPGAFLATQVPPEQKPELLQSELAEQLVAQALLPPQKNCPHSLPGSVRAATGAQVPTLPARLQASQVPSHALLQQAPSTQV